MLDFITTHFSEFFTFIGGFFTGGLTVKIYTKIKQHNITNKQRGDNIADSGSVAAGVVNAPVSIHNNNSRNNSPAIHAVGFAGEEARFVNCNSTVTINTSSLESKTNLSFSTQAKSLLKQFHESNGNLLLTFAPNGIIQNVQTNTSQAIEVTDILAVDSDLDNLEAWGYLQRKQDTNAGRMYSWTSRGKSFAITLTKKDC